MLDLAERSCCTVLVALYPARYRYECAPHPMPTFRVSATKDEQLTNAAVFQVLREDHTLGNIVRMSVACVFVPPLAALAHRARLLDVACLC